MCAVIRICSCSKRKAKVFWLVDSIWKNVTGKHLTLGVQHSTEHGVYWLAAWNKNFHQRWNKIRLSSNMKPLLQEWHSTWALQTCVNIVFQQHWSRTHKDAVQVRTVGELMKLELSIRYEILQRIGQGRRNFIINNIYNSINPIGQTSLRWQNRNRQKSDPLPCVRKKEQERDLLTAQQEIFNHPPTGSRRGGEKTLHPAMKQEQVKGQSEQHSKRSSKVTHRQGTGSDRQSENGNENPDQRGLFAFD